MPLFNLSVKHRIFVTIGFYILWVFGFTYFTYSKEKEHLFNSLDQQLEAAAMTASLLLPDDLHHHDMAKTDISDKSDSQNIVTLSNYTDNNDIVYIYTLILRDNKIYFTSSSATKEERRTSKGLSHYFDVYNDVDPRVFEVFKTKQKTFLQYSDQWGNFRSIFLPRTASDGTFYLAAADLSTGDIETLLNQQLYQSIVIALLFLLFAYPLYFIATQFVQHKAKELQQQLKDKSISLEENEQKLTLALSSAKQAWFEIDIPTGLIKVSGEYRDIIGIELGIAKPHASIKNWENNLHPDDRERIMQQFHQAILSDETMELEFRRKATDGSWVWIHSSGRVIKRDNSGNPITVIGINRDITERKRNELVLQTLAETGASFKSDILKIIVRQLAQSHNMPYAFIAAIDENAAQASTLVFWNNNQFVENVSYDLSGTPCETVLTDTGLAFYPDKVQQLFPDDNMLVTMKIESYLGVALRDSNNKAVGLITVMDSCPMKNSSASSSLMQSLAVRASIELERRQNEEKLLLFSYMFRDSHEGMLLVDKQDLIIDVNPAFCTATGYLKTELLGQPARIFRSKSHKYPLEFYDEIRQSVISKGSWQGEVWNRLKNGDETLAAVTITQIKDENNSPTHHFILVSDITEKKQQQDALKFLAHYDALTKLPNRALFVDRFHQAVAHCKRNNTMLAVCFLDLDNFKPVNDNYGHDVGDKILLEVAQRITSTIREEDTVSRQGGDEFTLLLGSINSFKEYELLLTRILHTVSSPYTVGEHTHNISASIGVTLYPQDQGDIDILTRHADQAMYQAKQAGKNQFRFFDTHDDRQKSQHQMLLHDLRQAIQTDQLCLHFQPKVNMKTGEVYGVEALIRWQHPEKGLLYPLDFLPATENTDLDIKIGEWVIKQSLWQMLQWKQQDINFQVSINISSNHLQSDNFITKLAEFLALYPEINSNLLQLEILESSALGDISLISKIISRCKNTLGVSIALDDFGTGYSSLTHLRNLPAETIKIDRSFVLDLLDDPNDFAIIEGVIGLAEAFNREVIAEGVESTEHGLMLLAMGCDEAQGYGIAKPMPAGDLPNWLQDYTPNQSWISCGNKPHTEQQTKIKFIRLTTEKWFKTIENLINSSENPAKTQKVSLCHLGVWLEQLRKIALFNEQWIEDIHQIHDELFQLGEQTIYAYTEQNSSQAIKKLHQLERVYNKLLAHLENYD